MKRLMVLLALLCTVAALAPAAQAAFTGVLYVTHFSSHAVDSINVVNGILQPATKGTINTLPGTDGVICNEQILELLIGGQRSNDVFRLNATNGAFGAVNTPDASITGGSYHLILSKDLTTIWTTSEDQVSISEVNYTTGVTTVHPVTGTAGNVLAGLEFSPTGTMYVTDSPNTGNGALYTLDLATFVATPVPGTGTRPAFHGITYDRYTGHYFLAGGGFLEEWDLSGPATMLNQWDVTALIGLPDPQAHLDQGWSDGKGNYFVTSNAGPIVYLDLTAPSPLPILAGDGGFGTDEITGCANATPPPCTITPQNPTICQGGSVQLCGPDAPGITYLWNTGETTQCITVSTDGDDTLITMGPTGLKDTCYAHVTVTQATCSVVPDNETLCTEDTATTKAEFCGPVGASAWNWSGPNGFTAHTQCISVAVPGTYTLNTTVNDCRSQCSATLSLQSCQVGCWMTGGGCLNDGQKKGHKTATFGGNVGPPPSGSWEHHEWDGKTLLFNFHSHGAHVDSCWQDDKAGPCHPAGPANNINWSGPGEYSIGNGPKTYAATFAGHVEDHGEPGNSGHNGKGGCGTTDYYRIIVWNAVTHEVAFGDSGYIDCGNLQLHKPKGSGKNKFTHNDPGTGLNNVSAPSAFALRANSPNPFTHTTNVAFAVPVSSHVKIGVYDISGRLVSPVVDDDFAAGEHVLVLRAVDRSGRMLPAGVYFYRMQAVGSNGEQYTRSMRMNVAR